MIWVTWRQHRTENLIALGLMAAFGTVLLITGMRIASSYHDLGIGACLPPGHDTQHCQDSLTAFTRAVGALTAPLPWANFLPLVFGVLLAAPLILDLESGTYRLAWTQSVTRTRWILGKLVLISLAAAVVGVALALAFAWWRAPLDHLYGAIQPNDSFDFEGVVPIGYVLFAVALVITTGTFFRRAIPAIGVSFVLFLVTRVQIQEHVRPYLLPPVKKVFPATVNPGGPAAAMPRSWVLDSGFSDRLGHAIPDQTAFRQMEACMSSVGPLTKGSPQMQAALASCARAHHLYNYVLYQPASRFWSLQLTELALYAVISALLLGITVWWVRNRIG